MADCCAQNSSDLKADNSVAVCDFYKIYETVMSKSIVYDGKRLRWCDNYDALQDFVKTAFGQLGKWWLSGGNSETA